MVLDPPLDRDGVFPLSRLNLCVGDGRWAFAETHAEAIDRHWTSALARQPDFFNGIVFMTESARFDGVALDARLIRVEFKAYLYWRETRYPAAGIIDGFGSALIRGSDGGVILVRQRPGLINTGLFYLPGGFIDKRDVDADGRVDMVACAIREVAEETGLTGATLAVEPGFVMTRAGAHLSFAVPFRANCPTADLLGLIRTYIEAHPAGELESVMAVRATSDLDGIAMPRYAQLLLPYVLASA